MVRRESHHDAVLGCLRTAGFSIRLTGHAFATLDAHLYGFLVQELSMPITNGDADLEEVAAQVARLRSMLGSSMKPELKAWFGQRLNVHLACEFYGAPGAVTS